jgi:hypothetical protein
LLELISEAQRLPQSISLSAGNGRSSAEGRLAGASPALGSGPARNGRPDSGLHGVDLAVRQRPEERPVRDPKRMAHAPRAESGCILVAVDGLDPFDDASPSARAGERTIS